MRLVALVGIEPDARGEPHQRAIPRLVLGEQHDGRARGPRVGEARGDGGRLGEVDGELGADDRLHPGLGELFRKLQRAEEIVGVGDRQRRHRVGLGELGQRLDGERALAQRKGGVHVQVHETDGSEKRQIHVRSAQGAIVPARARAVEGAMAASRGKKRRRSRREFLNAVRKGKFNAAGADSSCEGHARTRRRDAGPGRCFRQARRAGEKAAAVAARSAVAGVPRCERGGAGRVSSRRPGSGPGRRAGAGRSLGARRRSRHAPLHRRELAGISRRLAGDEGRGGLAPSRSFAAAAFTGLWLLYRKRYALGLMVMALQFGVTIAMPEFGALIDLALALAFGRYGKAIVVRDGLAAIAAARGEGGAADDASLRIARAGGTSLIAPIAGALVARLAGLRRERRGGGRRRRAPRRASRRHGHADADRLVTGRPISRPPPRSICGLGHSKRRLPYGRRKSCLVVR